MSDAQAGRRYVGGEQEEYGRDPYGSEPQQSYPGPHGYGGQQQYDPYGDVRQQATGPGYESYPQQYPGAPGPGQYAQPYPAQPGYPQQPPQYPQQYPQYPQQPPHIPQQAAPPDEQPPAPAAPPPAGAGPADGGFDTGEFAFIEEADEQAEDVIDWLKFTESRTERRDERKRRGRKRVIALAVLLVLGLLGGVGYIWQSGRLLGGGGSAASGAAQASGNQKRDVIVVHLRPVDSADSSTALLVGNETTGSGSTVLLPNSLVVTGDDGTPTTLGKSVVDAGEGPTRDSLNTLLSANIQGTWRLDTPFLEILVDSLGDITVDTDATVTSGGKTLVTPGKGQDLDGRAAAAYAAYRGPGESADKQLARFGQVLQAVLMKMPSGAADATKIVQNMGSIPDPSLSDAQLGALLARLSDEAKNGHYSTTELPVQSNGTLGRQATDTVVKTILGGTVKNTPTGGTPTVTVQNASGRAAAASSAQVAVVNSGDTYVDGGATTPVRSRSQVLYNAPAEAEAAKELAKTLGLPAGSVAKGTGEATTAITVVLGTDYKG